MIITGVLLVLLALLGAPLFAIIAVSALLGFGRIGVDPMVVPMEMYRIAETPVLLAPLSPGSRADCTTTAHRPLPEPSSSAAATNPTAVLAAGNPSAGIVVRASRLPGGGTDHRPCAITTATMTLRVILFATVLLITYWPWLSLVFVPQQGLTVDGRRSMVDSSAGAVCAAVAVQRSLVRCSCCMAREF